MLVPALAFAWWLVSLPVLSQEARGRASERMPAAEAVPERGQCGSDATKADARSETKPSSAKGNGTPETDRVALKLVTPPVVQTARSFLDLPMGAERYVTIEGHRYVFVLERHYHPPGFVGAPNGWHKGVTAYEVR